MGHRQKGVPEVEALWYRLIKKSLGHWIRDNGVTDLRLSGEILVNPRQAMAAIGQPVPEPTAPAAEGPPVGNGGGH